MWLIEEKKLQPSEIDNMTPRQTRALAKGWEAWDKLLSWERADERDRTLMTLHGIAP
ncbi:MAG: hypothetical protein IT209_00760 [Armatimonadetes bacterium]|nr:hypothetical protein [Armatimonadota bacterium]